MENRIIKFRGVTDNNELVYPDDRLFGGLKSCDILERFSIVNQFTGLHDKNGKEIYEADIMKDTDGYNYEVFWDKQYAQFVWSKNHIEDFSDESLKGEVIGNIFENKELLK